MIWWFGISTFYLICDDHIYDITILHMCILYVYILYIHLRHIIMYWVLCIISCTFDIDPIKSPFNQSLWIPKFCAQNIMVLLWKTASSSSFLLSPARRFWAAWKPLPAWDGQTSDWWYLLGIEPSKHRNSTAKNGDVTWCDEQEYTKMTGYDWIWCVWKRRYRQMIACVFKGKCWFTGGE